MARPRKEFSWEDVDKLCALQCTEEEIAQFLEISSDTLLRRCQEEHGVSFAEYFRQKRGLGKISLRRAQWTLAQKGNATLLIWLGKQYLDQKDKAETTTKNEHTFPNVSDSDLDAKIAAMLAKQPKGAE